MRSHPLLTVEAFGRAAAFLQQSRPLDQALFAFHFKQGSPEPVRAALKAYQNADGGFFGLEPDIGFPASTVLSTCHALHMLHEIGTASDHGLVQPALSYLLRNFDESLDAWPIIPPQDNSRPHAPWWHYSDKFTENWHRFQDNPRPDALACLSTFPSEITATLRQHVTHAVVSRLNQAAHEIELDSVRCYLRLYDAPAISPELHHALEKALPSWIEKSVERDPSNWSGYRLRPLEVAPAADSPWRKILGESIAQNLDYLIQNQTPAGCWDPHWHWGDFFPEAWPAAKQKWQAVLTLANLRTLRSYGRISRP